MLQILKYPRTPHVIGSHVQPGDEDQKSLAFDLLQGCHLVVEEKVDGSNCGISVGPNGNLRLQSRGHYLTGGPRERQFDLFKAWSQVHKTALTSVLGRRYVMYGEWLYAKHMIYYDALPHYFLEFDVLDVETGAFLTTESRRALLAGLPICSVPVLTGGVVESHNDLLRLIGRSAFRTAAWRERLAEAAAGAHVEFAQALNQTDSLPEMEGLYIKVEADGRVVQRCKFIRASFRQSVSDLASHWMSRPLIPNRLAEGVDIFADTL